MKPSIEPPGVAALFPAVAPAGARIAPAGALPENTVTTPLRSIEERNALVVENLRLVYWLLKKLQRGYGCGGGFRVSEDSAQEAAIALIRAAANWIPERGKFSTYGLRCIYNHLASHRGTDQLIRLPANAFAAVADKRKRRQSSTEVVANAMQTFKVVSLALPFSGDEDTNEPHVEDTTVDDSDAAMAVHASLRRLTARERDVVELRYGLRDGRERTLEETSPHVGGVTRERVRQIESRALGKLERYLREAGHG